MQIDRSTAGHIFFEPRRTVYFPSQITSNRVDINLRTYPCSRGSLVTFAEFWKGVPFRWCTSENNTFSEAKRAPRKLAARVSSACISGSLQCRSGNQQEEIFSPVHCLRVRSRTTLSHEWHPRAHRRWIGSPSFLFPSSAALCAQVEWKMTGVSCDPQQRNVIISRFYRSFYRGEPSPDFSPSRVTSTPLDDRIQKRWASFYKSATYISYIYVRIERRWTIVVCFLFASPSIRWPRCSGTEDRIRWKNLRISFFEVSVWRFVKRVYLNNIRKWNRLVCRFASYRWFESRPSRPGRRCVSQSGIKSMVLYKFVQQIFQTCCKKSYNDSK